MMIERIRIAVISAGVSAALLLAAASPALAQRGGGHGGGGAPVRVGPGVAGPTHIVAGPVRGPVAVTSHVGGPVYGAPRGPYYSYGHYPYYGYRYPGYGYAVHYSYPYYAFHPHFSIGIGFSVGYPVAYPYAYVGGPYYGAYYGYPYYAYPPAYAPYPAYPAYPAYPPPAPAPTTSYPSQPSSSIQVSPGSSAIGGLSFEVTPSNAAVFIDGVYVGPARDFSPTSAPLNLSAGKHHVEVRAQGYETMTFEADVTNGQVVPYRGSLQPIK